MLNQQSQQYFAGVRSAYSPKIDAILSELTEAGKKFQELQHKLKSEWAAFMRSACNAQPGDIIELADGTQVLLAALIPEEHTLPGGVRLRSFYPLVHAKGPDGEWTSEMSRYRYASLPFKVVGHDEVPGEGTLAERMKNALPDLVESPAPVVIADDTVEEKPDVAPAKPTKPKPAKKAAAKKAAAKKKKAPAKKTAVKKAAAKKKAPAKKTAAKKSATKKKATKKAAAKKPAKKAANESKNTRKRKT